MKRVVLDTSVAMKWFFPESGREKALGLKDKHVKGEIAICTRELFLYEFTSALRNYQGQTIGEKDYALAAETLASLQLNIYPLSFAELDNLFKLSGQLLISVYDCSYLLLAQKLEALLYTSDRLLYAKAKRIIRAVLV